MIRSALVISVTNVNDDRICISAFDSEKFFPVILFCKYTDVAHYDLGQFLADKPFDSCGNNRHLCVDCYPQDDYFRVTFPYKVHYVFYKCKDGKFRTYLR